MKKKIKNGILKSIFSFFSRILWFSSSAGLIWLGAGWCLCFFSLLALMDFHPIVKLTYTIDNPVVPFWRVFLLLAIGVVGLVVGFRRLPPKDAPDINRRNAWICLGAIFAVGAFLRLRLLDQVPAPFWDDWADTLTWAHIIIDKNRFYWMFPTDGREPFYPYALVSMMSILPSGMNDITVMRITNCLVDLTALWLLYLAGKELGSRRIGLVAAALGAAGKPMLQMSLTGMRVFSLSLAVVFLLLASLKLLRKPTLSHFLLWSVALAFGVHTYSVYRSFMLVVPFLLLFWVLAKREERRFNPIVWASALGATLLLTGIYSGTIASTHPAFLGLQKAWKALVAQPWAMAGLFTLCLAFPVYAVRKTWRKGLGSRLAGWSLAVGLSSLMVYPLSKSQGFTRRLASVSPFHQDQEQNPLIYLAHQAWETVKALFYFCQDRDDLRIGVGAFYDIYSQGAVILGLVFLLALPQWKKAFLLMLGALGTLAYLLSLDPASSKLMASAPPLYLLAGWAVSRIWAGLPRIVRKGGFSLAPYVLTGLLVFYGTWGAVVQYEKLYHFWAEQGCPNDSVLAKQISVYEPRYRVYVAHSAYFFGWAAQFILNQGKRYYLFKKNNAVSVERNGTPQDVVVLVFGPDKKTQEKIRREFPSAQWEKKLIFQIGLTNPNPELYLWAIMIPGSSLSNNPKALLYRQETDGAWLRRYYNPHFGWGLSAILKEEYVERFSAPIPYEKLFTAMFDSYNNGRLVRILGTLEVEKTGKYEWSCVYQDPMWLRIDGKTLWKRDAPDSEGKYTSRIRLEKGTHQVEALVRMVTILRVPQVNWREADEPTWENF